MSELLLEGKAKRVVYSLFDRCSASLRSISKGRDRTVYRRSDGSWANKRNDAERASSVHDTQAAAAAAAHGMLSNQGRGELSIKGRDGRIRSKDTVAPGNDPNPPRDREH